MTEPGVAAEAPMADHRVVLTAEADDEVMSYFRVATRAARASRAAPAEVRLDRRPGCGRLSRGGVRADVGVVAP